MASTAGVVLIYIYIYIAFTFPLYASFVIVASSFRIARVSHGQKATVSARTTEAALDFGAIPAGGSSHTSDGDPQ